MHDPKSSASSPAKHMAPPRATPFSPKNHPKREAPQPMPATTLAKKKIGCVTVCHLAIHRRRPPIRAARVSKRYQKIRIPIASNANRRPNQCRRLCILLDPLECPRATPSPHTISTFRRFDSSTFPPKITQIANRPNPRPPQHLPTPPKTFFAYCHLAIHRRRAPIRAARVSKRYQKIRIPIAFNANRRRNQCRRLCILLDPLECPRATPPPLTISTFRLFDVSTFLPSPPTHARHRIYNRKKSAVSLYVTFDVSFPRGAPTRLAVWRRITSPAPHRRASKKLS